MNLNEKIKKRETELQRNYDLFLIEKQKSIEKINELRFSLKKEEAYLKSINLMIRKCYDRAIKQNCLNEILR
jgi:hypothetical protein